MTRNWGRDSVTEPEGPRPQGTGDLAAWQGSQRSGRPHQPPTPCRGWTDPEFRVVAWSMDGREAGGGGQPKSRERPWGRSRRIAEKWFKKWKRNLPSETDLETERGKGRYGSVAPRPEIRPEEGRCPRRASDLDTLCKLSSGGAMSWVGRGLEAWLDISCPRLQTVCSSGRGLHTGSCWRS